MKKKGASSKDQVLAACERQHFADIESTGGAMASRRWCAVGLAKFHSPALRKFPALAGALAYLCRCANGRFRNSRPLPYGKWLLPWHPHTTTGENHCFFRRFRALA